ncbi:MAG: hypothetical protein ACI8V5_002242 [Limisphaerales bacterium]|jgi:hypothetical protein
MSIVRQQLENRLLTRRQLLQRCGMGMGTVGLATALDSAGILAPAAQAAGYKSPLAPRAPQFAGKAKRVIHLFMNGGPSHVDTFDPKHLLKKHAGKALPADFQLRTERPTGAAYPSPFEFKKYGQSGIEVSELFQHTAKHIDDICLVHSMHANVPNHEPSLMLMNCGEARLIRPSMGSWVNYGLGSDNRNLPGFVVLCPGFPIAESQNWQSAFLPGVFQGTHINTKTTDVEKLIENIRNRTSTLKEQRTQLDFLQQLNERHRKQRQEDAEIDARIQSFELAYRMQLEATDAFDVTREPESVRKMYGDTVQARQILMARRLVERGVRYVQVWHGDGQPWDSHDRIEKNHRRLAGECDQAIGALLADLKQRGMLDDTLVLWGGEFGRTPTVELPKPGSNAGTISGRDHNHYGFTMWMAGGGVKGGHIHGATDEFGFQAVKDKVHVHDLHATMLHLLGFDHERLTFRHAGRDFRLTDVEGHVVEGILA